LAAAYLLCAPSHSTAETLRLSKELTGPELRCLHDLLTQYFVRYPGADAIRNLIAESSTARTDLRGTGEQAFIFVIHDIGYCGSAGCLMLIGERRFDHKCHILTAANSDGGEVIVLARRDHGYRRLSAPCELYFDGRRYQQVHEKCPNINVQR
jgi:hypothetical protein